jgi:hypothetical protein
VCGKCTPSDFRSHVKRLQKQFKAAPVLAQQTRPVSQTHEVNSRLQRIMA